jgi:hypothetical protein
VVASWPRLSPDLLSHDPGIAEAPASWNYAVRNDGQNAHAYGAAAICSSLPALTVVGDFFVVGAHASNSDRVLCPAGAIATGGGYNSIGLGVMAASGPVLDDGTPDGLRLISASDGAGPAPIGWRLSVRNDGTSSTSVKPAVVCIPSAPANTGTEIASVAVAAGGADSTRALCPVGQIAFGGGVDVNDVQNMTIVASAPIFDDGTVNGERLINRVSGPDGAPIGWFAAARNQDDTDHTLRVAAICPEPVAPAEEAFAAAGVLLIAACRRRSPIERCARR